jgi:hypothetical protein
VGPTSGLPGFFLGPLWFYVGFIGYLLSNGNPYGICLWLISLSCLALPLFWYLSHQLFKRKIWAVTCAVLLAVIPGSIRASIFVWNPLMSVPLMTGTLLLLWKGRESRKFLTLGFFLLALTLQSEFAYAVFFMPVLFCLIPWIRRKFDIKDYVFVCLAIGVTFIPQLLFEVRNHFIMTTSLIHAMGDSSQSATWKELFALRPHQLFENTADFFFGPGQVKNSSQLSLAFISILFISLFAAVRLFTESRKEKTKEPNQKIFLWKLVILFTVIPYPFYMIWRGNHGYFFDYYITPHFIFVLPFILLGLQELIRLTQTSAPIKSFSKVVVGVILLMIGLYSFSNWQATVLQPHNDAGLAKMLDAVSQIYEWQKEDKISQATVRVYTPNVYTEQYDYLLGWYARSNQLQNPQTVFNGTEKTWYLLLESKDHAQKVFFDPWYAAATKDGKMVRQKQIGVLTLETWQK